MLFGIAIKKKYRKSGSKQNKCNKKKESAAHGGKGQEKRGWFCWFFFPQDLGSFVSCSVLSESLHPEEAVPVHTELVLNKDSISFANAYCQGRECQHRGKHPYPTPPAP